MRWLLLRQALHRTYVSLTQASSAAPILGSAPRLALSLALALAPASASATATAPRPDLAATARHSARHHRGPRHRCLTTSSSRPPFALFVSSLPSRFLTSTRDFRAIHHTRSISAAAPDPSLPAHQTATMNRNTTSPSSKRKAQSSPNNERPHKHHRAINGRASAGDNTPDTEVGPVGYEDEDVEGDLEDTNTRPVMIGAQEPAEWQETIQNVVRNVVSIRFCQTCSFDTDAALTSEATGFVVDAERGYVSASSSLIN
jgi:hypothetical protein